MSTKLIPLPEWDANAPTIMSNQKLFLAKFAGGKFDAVLGLYYIVFDANLHVKVKQGFCVDDTYVQVPWQDVQSFRKNIKLYNFVEGEAL